MHDGSELTTDLTPPSGGPPVVDEGWEPNTDLTPPSGGLPAVGDRLESTTTLTPPSGGPPFRGARSANAVNHRRQKAERRRSGAFCRPSAFALLDFNSVGVENIFLYVAYPNRLAEKPFEGFRLWPCLR